MQDPRLRLLCALLLSFAAFASIAGAGAVFLWWLVFTARRKSIRHVRALVAALLLVVLIAAVMIVSGSDGLSYLVRMTALLLVGAWVYADTRPADFLATGVWLGGRRTGFELGMTAEMAMGMAEGLFDDFSRIRIATMQKGVVWGPRSLLPAGRVLVRDALRRAEETAEILAVRGYRGGGTACTRFAPTFPEIIAALCAVAACIVAVFPRW
jgi:energy-coupling factor transport system permease protein